VPENCNYRPIANGETPPYCNTATTRSIITGRKGMRVSTGYQRGLRRFAGFCIERK